jgi:hypothetical protein
VPPRQRARQREAREVGARDRQEHPIRPRSTRAWCRTGAETRKADASGVTSTR